MEKGNNKNITENLRRNLFLYMACILFAFSFFLILTTAKPIYERLKESENNNVRHNIEVRAMAVNEWIRHSMSVAVQVTSRSRIRQELEKYNNGTISLAQLKSFTEPKLSDAMNISKEIAGITRLDNSGKVVAQCGEMITSLPSEINYTGPFDTSLSTPIAQNGRQMLIVSAPIISRSKKYVGADLVLIDLYQLKNITNNASSENVAKTVLGYSYDGAVYGVFTEIKKIKDELVKGFSEEDLYRPGRNR